MMKTIPFLRLFIGTVGVSALVGFPQAEAADLTVTGNLNVDGDATSDGDLSWGLISGTTWAGTLRYFPPTISPVAPAQLTSDATEEAAFSWNDLVAGSNVHFKMRLDEDNILTLYKSGTGGGNTAAIQMTPDSGAIKLHGTGAGLFNGSGGGVLQIDSTGKAYFPNRALFQGGIDFGSTGGVFDGAKAQYLQGVLTNFGYDPNAATYSDVRKFSVPGLNVSKVIFADAGIFVAGTFSEAITIGSTTYQPYNGRHIIAKILTNNTLGWAKQIKTADASGPDSFTIKSIAVNSSGSVAIGGAFTGSTTNLSSLNLTSDGSSNGFIIALNSSGVPQWSKVISSATSTEETVDGLAIDSSGNVAAAGSFKGGSVDFGNGARSTAGNRDGFAVKYNSSGTAQWSLPIGGSSDNDKAQAVAFGASGAVIVGGQSNNITNLDSNTYWSGNTQDAWAASFSSSGTFQWVKMMGGNFAEDYLKGLATDSSGNTYALVDFYWATTSLGAGFNKTAVGNGNDTIVVSLNTSGAVRWTQAIGGAGYDSGVGIDVDSSGAVLVAANFQNSTSTLPSGYNVTSSGGGDGLLLVTDTSGNVGSSKAFGGTGEDSLQAVDPWGTVSGGIMLYGTMGAATDYGDTRIPPGLFTILQPGGTITTRPAATPATLAWGGGVAEGSGSSAFGPTAYADGVQSVAFSGSVATGANAFAANTAKAQGSYSAAFGNLSTASGAGSTALGNFSSASGSGSFAAGEGGSASGYASVSLGYGNWASGDAAVAMGDVNTASAYAAAAFGSYTTASGGVSTAFGAYTRAYGTYSTTFGYDTEATGASSLAAGIGIRAASYASTIVGQYNISSGTPGSWVLTDDLFVVGNGPDYSNRSNALVVKKNGSLAAGTGVVIGNVPTGSSQVVVGVYNDTSTDTSTTPDTIRGEGVFTVGAGETTSSRKNAIRVTRDGVVLVQPSGELSMGTFTSGEKP